MGLGWGEALTGYDPTLPVSAPSGDEGRQQNAGLPYLGALLTTWVGGSCDCGVAVGRPRSQSPGGEEWEAHWGAGTLCELNLSVWAPLSHQVSLAKHKFKGNIKNFKASTVLVS